jgi:uncharacterized membrane protein YhaH (DUF805 family)
MSWLQRLFGFQGRIGRRDFWLIVAGVVIVDAIVMAIYPYSYVPPALMSEEDPMTRATLAANTFQANWINAIVGVLLLWPAIAASVKRCHDRNRSGLWLLVFWGPALISGALGLLVRDLWLVWAYGLATPFYIWPAGPFLTASTVALVLWFWGLIDLGLMPGTTGPNRYGRPPASAASSSAPAAA